MPSRKERIRELKQRAGELSAGKVESWTADDMPDEQALQFWSRVVAFEEGPFTTNFQQLTELGIDLPEPSSVTDDTLSATLWAVIHGLAQLRVCLEDTDHLSDRELYEWLWTDLLREEVPAAADEGAVGHAGPLMGGSEEATAIYLRYYADDTFRQNWLRDFPDTPLPPQQEPPHDRDRLLPRPGPDSR